ncbi:MAG: hypothetical protein ABJF04_18015 [Reichenbachiella sp.]|uniref:hypothetical protein n=1 Tax=Reichenbachiella sp. TaxID=2184521 RepID=UPI0032658EDB
MKYLVQSILLTLSVSTFFCFTDVDSKIDIDSPLSNTNSLQTDSIENPFRMFKGEWLLKDNIFESEFDGEYNANVNPNMSFIAKEFNTKTSIFWIEDLGSIRAQIYWTYNSRTREVNHLSSNSNGGGAIGKGKFKENGDLELKLIFNNACEGCYQVFSYEWKSEDELFFRSRLFENDQSTGNYYGFTLIRKNN